VSMISTNRLPMFLAILLQRSSDTAADHCLVSFKGSNLPLDRFILSLGCSSLVKLSPYFVVSDRLVICPFPPFSCLSLAQAALL
jgi:hypothetical protein